MTETPSRIAELKEQLAIRTMSKTEIGRFMAGELATALGSDQLYRLGAKTLVEILSMPDGDSNIPGADKPVIISETHTGSGDGAKQSLVIKSPIELKGEAEIAEAFGIDLSLWFATQIKCGRWEMGYKDAKSNPGSLPLWRVSATFERRKQKDIDHLAAFKECLEKYPVSKQAKESTVSSWPENGGKMMEIAISDLHLGKLAWWRETGSEYNLEIAKECFYGAIQCFAKKAIEEGVTRFLLPIGNDLLNMDGPHGNTTSGTPQSNAASWGETYREAFSMLYGGIATLASIGEVIVVCVPGNHDSQTAFTLTHALSTRFSEGTHKHNTFFDIEPSLRKYHLFGNVLLGFTHGDKEKMNDLLGLMAVEQAHDWGRSHFREFHVGHLHKTAAMRPTHDELHGFRVRVMPSLSGTDSWHHSKGYVGNIQAAEAFIWDAERGLDSIHYYRPR